MSNNQSDRNEIILTLDGIKKLEEELERLKTVSRKEVAARIKDAKAFGDLTENAEYDEAKNEQAFIEGRILQIENTLRNARVVDDDELDTDSVAIGITVKVLDINEDEELVYTIVGSAEADPINGRISNDSPVGRALIGQRRGAEVSVQTPGGGVTMRLLDIFRI